LQRRSWKRLGAAVAAYEHELRGRAECSNISFCDLAAIHEALDEARAAHAEGDIDRGWKLMLAAQRLEYLTLKGEDLCATAAIIRNEAQKLGDWRERTILELLAPKNGKPLEPAHLFRAALVRDEYFANNAYKGNLARANALRLSAILLATLAALVVPSYWGNLSGGSDAFTSGNSLLLNVLLIGLLGATVSAITNADAIKRTNRIPEMISALRVTLMRLVIGPASAFVIYLVFKSGLFERIFEQDLENPYSLLVISFVAGFTERLVMRVVEAVNPRAVSA
jgi:hypothetical protein